MRVRVASDVSAEGPIEISTKRLLQNLSRGIDQLIDSIPIGADADYQMRVSCQTA